MAFQNDVNEFLRLRQIHHEFPLERRIQGKYFVCFENINSFVLFESKFFLFMLGNAGKKMFCGDCEPWIFFWLGRKEMTFARLSTKATRSPNKLN